MAAGPSVHRSGFRISRRRALTIAGPVFASACFTLKRYSDSGHIPFLITIDVHDSPNLDDVVNRCLERLSQNKLNVTFLVPAVCCRRPGFNSTLKRALSLGHQVGCHGLYHDGTEDYYTDAFEVQRRNLACAKQLIEDAVGTLVSTFRAPEFHISKDTLNVLDTLGFRADLSVCSQRMPLLSSQIGNYHWLVSPRTPYHPSRTNPYAKGHLKLLEIPTSAILLPLMSALNSVSEMTTEFITRILRYEAAFVSKPIVYQCHAEDFVLVAQLKNPMKITWRSLIPSRHGIPLRWAFEETDGNVLYRRNQEFLSFVMQTLNFRFLTVDEYVDHHEFPTVATR